jgi:pSer/pThr/pTyr-binding forkhead associated (FHA) protein
MYVTLILQKGGKSRQEIVVKAHRTTIGRKRSCNICIPALEVSRQHCEILIENGKVRLRDLGSSNGTWVNGVQVDEAELATGDTVAIGPVLFLVRISQEQGSDTVRPGEQPALSGSATAPPLPSGEPVEAEVVEGLVLDEGAAAPDAIAEAEFVLLEAEPVEPPSSAPTPVSEQDRTTQLSSRPAAPGSPSQQPATPPKRSGRKWFFSQR